MAVFLYSQEDNKNNELIIAVFNDDIEETIKLLSSGADVNSKTEEGITPLMYASQNGNLDIVELLLANGANVNDKPNDGFTALISACLFNHLEVAITLIENHADINASNMYGATALMVASAYGYYIITDMLLYYGAEIELKDYWGNTALNIASTHGFYDIALLLMSKGADINTKDEQGFTPLMSAVIKNNVQTVDTLLSANPDINVQNNKGYTALMLALRLKNDTLVKKISHLKFDKELQNNYRQNTSKVALINKNRCFYSCYGDDKKYKKYLPYFKSISVNSGFLFSFKDVFFDYGLDFTDVRYGLHVNAGHSTRIGKKSILVKANDNVYYQYNEKRSLIYTGISKDFLLSYSFKSEKGMNAGLKMAYTFGKIEGTEKDVKNAFLPVPSLGFYYSTDFFRFKSSYEFINFNVASLASHFINLSLAVNINLRKNPTFKKSIYWVY